MSHRGLVKGVARGPETAEDDMNMMFATNVTGLVNMTQEVLRGMLRRNNEAGAGDIINIGSIAGREPYPGGGIYCATKVAVGAFADRLRKELIATRVRVICVDPGQVETEFSVVRFYGDNSKADAVYAGCEPLTADDIAEAVVFTVGRRENVVVADSLIFPDHQAGATTMHKKTWFLDGVCKFFCGAGDLEILVAAYSRSIDTTTSTRRAQKNRTRGWVPKRLIIDE